MKMKKKGFTLAELLIVIAIIAILIAIAIPVFTAQLRAARLSTDHANIRSAYAWAQSANLMGSADVDASGTIDTGERNADLGKDYEVKFGRDGKIAKTVASVYTLQVTADSDECLESPACGSNHVQNAELTIKLVEDATTNELVWTVFG